MTYPARPLLQARSGAAALEFAIVCIPFLTLLLGVLAFAINFYLQFALDYSLQQAVRQVQLGLLPSNVTAANFTNTVLCPTMVRFAPCTGIQVSVQPVTDFYTASVITAANLPSCFSVGAPGQLMYARAVYQAPPMSSLVTAVTNLANATSTGQTLVSAAAFANENPSGAAVSPAIPC